MCEVCTTYGLKPAASSLLGSLPLWVRIAATWLIAMLLAVLGPIGWTLLAIGGGFGVRRLLEAHRRRKAKVVLNELPSSYCKNGLAYLAEHEPARLNAAYESAAKKAFTEAGEEDAPGSVGKQEVREQQERHVRDLEKLLAQHVRRRGVNPAEVAEELEVEKRILSHFETGDEK